MTKHVTYTHNRMQGQNSPVGLMSLKHKIKFKLFHIITEHKGPYNCENLQNSCEMQRPSNRP